MLGYGKSDGIGYFNAGGWTDSPVTYVTVDSDGVRVHEYLEQPNDDNSHNTENDTALAESADDSGVPQDAEYEDVYG